MKKKIRQIFLLTALICTLLIGFAFGVSAEETFTEGIYTYTVADGEATITDVNITDESDIVLPEILGGYPVTATCYVETISNDIYIHSGIEKIEGLDFWGFASNIYVDENNLNFSSEDGVLYNKDKTVLLKYPTLNKNTSFEVPESVKIIEKAAFYFAVNLEEIKLNEGLEEIRDLSFGYTRINGIDLPSTLKTINGNAFVLCPMIEKIIIPESVNYIDMLFTYFPLEVYIESTNVTFGEWETFGVVDFYMDISRENLATAYKNFAETYDYSELEKCLNESIVQSDVPVVHNKYYCHEGANYIELMDAVATAKNVETLYEYTHFFKDWTYDWENYERTAKCLHCDATTTEALEKPENIETETEIEIIAPVIDEDTKFVVETVEDEASDNYILVTEALEAVEGPAEIEKIYDITLETSEGVAVQPDGSVQVKLPVEESHGNYKVFRVNDDGTYTDMNATVVDGYVVFVTDHFSLYVVVDTTEKTCEHEFDYTKSEANLTRPSQADGTWVDGYYTYTCSLCGETETEVAKRADYAEYDAVETRFVGIFLNEAIDDNIRLKLLEELQATEVEFKDNFIESEQQTLDRFTDYLLACIERAEVCVEGTHFFTKYEEVTAPKCGVAGLEKSVCDYCGAEDENEIPALKHVPLAAVKENEIAPDCEAAGSYESVVYCDLCGGEISRETITVSAKGHTKVTVPGKAATCKETGLTDGVKCSVCGKILTAQKTIAKADHKDKNGDYKCDYGCGHEFERPTPDKCDHMCHQSGFMGFIWKIVQFFWKLFKMNPVCECGAAHY